MIIPHQNLEKATLASLLEEIATRDGTDYGANEYSLETKVSHLQQALISNKAVLWFDVETESCAVISAELAQNYCEK